jgi:hypothetical protein
MSTLKASLINARDSLNLLLEDQRSIDAIHQIISLIVTTFQNNNKI